MFLINILLQFINFHDYHQSFAKFKLSILHCLLYTSEVMILKIELEDKY